LNTTALTASVEAMLFLRQFVLLLAFFVSCESSSLSGNRYSFSLSTFDPSGKILQVDRALEAASKGTPIVALVFEENIFLAAPQSLPSHLIIDDGSPRFTRISSEIFIAHTGLSADGRVVTMNADRFALNYVYSFDEEIPIETFIQKLSLLFQEYTMKPGHRPFGCTILVGYVPSNGTKIGRCPQLFRVDPSGSVSNLHNGDVVNWEQGVKGLNQLRKRIQDVGDDKKDQCATLSDWLYEQLSSWDSQNDRESVHRKILVAGGFSDGSFIQYSHQYN
jgi:hypothetical protein